MVLETDDIIANGLKDLAFFVFSHTAGPDDFTNKMNALNRSWIAVRNRAAKQGHSLSQLERILD